MQIDKYDSQPIIHAGRANHFRNGEAVGGKLYLLTDKLHFKSHKFNFQNHEYVMKLREIKEVGYFNTLGIISNGLYITTNEKTEKFIVENRQLWFEEIERVKNACA